MSSPQVERAWLLFHSGSLDMSYKNDRSLFFSADNYGDKTIPTDSDNKKFKKVARATRLLKSLKAHGEKDGYWDLIYNEVEKRLKELKGRKGKGKSVEPAPEAIVLEDSDAEAIALSDEE